MHGDIHIWDTGEKPRERLDKHRYDAKNKPNNSELGAHKHKHQHEFDKDVEVLILKGNLHQKHERKLWEDKSIRLLGRKVPTGNNVKLKHYGFELYETFTDLTA